MKAMSNEDWPYSTDRVAAFIAKVIGQHRHLDDDDARIQAIERAVAKEFPGMPRQQYQHALVLGLTRAAEQAR